MNFYKHHIGDYAQATAHLTFVEDAAYMRLLRKYYAEEKPLPADLRAVQRLSGARTKEEKKAVEDVLSEFFFLQDDGWHNKRCDEEIVRANAQAETNRKIANARESRRKSNALDKSSGTNQARDGIDSLDGHAPLRERQEHESYNENTTSDARQEHESCNESLSVREPSQTPDSRLQTPDNKTLTPGSAQQPQPQPSVAPRKRAATVQGKPVSLSGETWEAYSRAYETRYGVAPIRNATVSGQLANFVKRIGQVEAPSVAEFYVLHPGQFYVRAMHSIAMMVRDAEKLRTEWATGQMQTERGHGKNQRHSDTPRGTPAERVRANYPDVFGEGADDEFGRLIDVTPTHGGHLG